LTDKKARDAVIRDFIHEAERYLLKNYYAIVNNDYRTYFENFIANIVNQNLKTNFNREKIMQEIKEAIDEKMKGFKN
jgi:hypothetical protein